MGVEGEGEKGGGIVEAGLAGRVVNPPAPMALWMPECLTKSWAIYTVSIWAAPFPSATPLLELCSKRLRSEPSHVPTTKIHQFLPGPAVCVWVLLQRVGSPLLGPQIPCKEGCK